MKKSTMAKIGLLAALFAMSACEDSEEKKVCDIAREFADAYYNLNIRKAEIYCTLLIRLVLFYDNSGLIFNKTCCNCIK